MVSLLRKRSRSGSAASAFVLLILIVLILLVGYYFILPYFSPAAPELKISPNWAGYMVVSDLSSPAPMVAVVNGSWTVPSVTGTSDSYSAVWIGIGGQYDTTLVQAGTLQDWVNGQAEYSAFYEALPAGLITIDSINVSPGDVISVSISLVDSAANIWSIELLDGTTGQSFQTSLAYGSTQLSAEWIVERPTLVADNQIATMPDFGSIQFTGCIVKMGSGFGGIRDFPRLQYSMYELDLNSTLAIANVSPLSADGKSFTVTFLGRT